MDVNADASETVEVEDGRPLHYYLYKDGIGRGYYWVCFCDGRTYQRKYYKLQRDARAGAMQFLALTPYEKLRDHEQFL